jgi:hypothetical protein
LVARIVSTDLWPRATVTRRIRQAVRDADDLLSRISEVTDGPSNANVKAAPEQASAATEAADTQRQTDAVLSGTH